MPRARVEVRSHSPLRYFGIAFLLLMALAGGAVLFILYWPNSFPGGGERALFVSRGETFGSVVDSLEASGMIRSRMLYLITADLLHGRSHIRIGKYVFNSGTSNAELVRAIAEGREIVPIPVTIPEGLTVRRQAKIFARHLGIDSSKYVDLADDTAFVHQLGLPGNSLEGYLLPDTYFFNWQTDEHDILRELAAAFKRFFSDSLKQRARVLGMSEEDVVTMASIVEGESRLSEERPIIAGVYYNRLRIGMRLDADPTIQYILDGRPRRLSYDDLKLDSPYNTYQHAGLPPGPINNPGKASILAALYPAQHQYLYFVANGKGGHWFSRTFEEHRRYVRMARRLRALAERSQHSHPAGQHP